MSQLIEELKEDFPLLIEAGFVAVKQLDGISSHRIFQAAQTISPNSTAPKIGMGYIALNKLEVKEATRIFEEVVEQEPKNWLAQTFLGICYLLSKTQRKKGKKLIHEAIGQTDDPTVKNLGEISLEWCDKDLEKLDNKKNPFFQKEEES
jgi:hypothetical protein